MRGLNLEKALLDERNRRQATSGDETLANFKAILAAKPSEGAKIIERLYGTAGKLSTLKPEKLDASKVYHVEDIKSICIQYRLRFLDSFHFKGVIPADAIQKIEALQKEHNETLEGFKIVAPANMFNLRDRDKDPLLFVHLGNQNYYLIHKWGGDLHPLRKLFVYPFRSFETLFFCVVALALFISLAIPSSVMVQSDADPEFGIRGIVFFYFFFAFSGLTALYGFKHLKNFNNKLWNSKYFS